MKTLLSYNDLNFLASRVVTQIRLLHETALKEKRVYLFAVARGGLTFGHLVSSKMKMPLGVAFPLADGDVKLCHPAVPNEPGDYVFIYLEDVIAKGRTFHQVMSWHKRIYGDYVRGVFVPVILDSGIGDEIRSQVNIYGTESSDWVVFPHEDHTQVVEGDHGLFRDGTSENSKQ